MSCSGAEWKARTTSSWTVQSLHSSLIVDGMNYSFNGFSFFIFPLPSLVLYSVWAMKEDWRWKLERTHLTRCVCWLVVKCKVKGLAPVKYLKTPQVLNYRSICIFVRCRKNEGNVLVWRRIWGFKCYISQLYLVLFAELASESKVTNSKSLTPPLTALSFIWEGATRMEKYVKQQL